MIGCATGFPNHQDTLQTKEWLCGNVRKQPHFWQTSLFISIQELWWHPWNYWLRDNLVGGNTVILFRMAKGTVLRFWQCWWHDVEKLTVSLLVLALIRLLVSFSLFSSSQKSLGCCKILSDRNSWVRNVGTCCILARCAAQLSSLAGAGGRLAGVGRLTLLATARPERRQVVRDGQGGRWWCPPLSSCRGASSGVLVAQWGDTAVP